MMNRNVFSGLMLAAMLVGFSSSSALADDAGRKLGRGLANTFFGIVEIPIQVQRTNEAEGGGAAITWGVCRGIGHFFMREGVGIYEILTFPIPYPRYYEPILHPEFLLNDME